MNSRPRKFKKTRRKKQHGGALKGINVRSLIKKKKLEGDGSPVVYEGDNPEWELTRAVEELREGLGGDPKEKDISESKKGGGKKKTGKRRNKTGKRRNKTRKKTKQSRGRTKRKQKRSKSKKKRKK